MFVCPAKECSKQFGSSRALSSHINRCKFMPGVLAATAKHYAELDRPRKRRRTSFSTAAGDGEEQDDSVEAVDFEVSHDTFIYFQFLMVHEQSQVEEPLQPSPLPPEDHIDDLSEVPEASSSRPRRNAQPPL
jgi:hypothetical protein